MLFNVFYMFIFSLICTFWLPFCRLVDPFWRPFWAPWPTICDPWLTIWAPWPINWIPKRSQLELWCPSGAPLGSHLGVHWPPWPSSTPIRAGHCLLGRRLDLPEYHFGLILAQIWANVRLFLSNFAYSWRSMWPCFPIFVNELFSSSLLRSHLPARLGGMRGAFE